MEDRDQASAQPPADQQPVLIAIEGPVRGTIFALQDCPLTIGRKSDNGIAVPDSSISRRHCTISRQPDGYIITDLDSQNGTIVNGVPVKKRVLAPGDRIQVGECLFVFSFGAGKRSESGLTLANDDAAERSTIIMPAESGARLTGRFSPGENEARRLQVLEALVRISSSINSIRDVGHLSERLLAELFDAVPLERGAIVLGLDPPSDPQRVFAYDRRLGAIAPFPISRAVLERCLQENVAILSDDPGSQCGTPALQNTVLPVVYPLVAAPLTLFGKVIGLIYLDSSHEGVHVDRFHLQLVTAAAAIGAVALESAMRLEYLESEKERLEAEINVRHELVGESPAMQELHRFLSRVAPLNTTVLITGESGTGKELVALALHRNSTRAGEPFVAINCAAITETLLESELFGYEKGAFTGAFARKRGKLETADGGTLFLDEVGELALPLQAKLLRVIQEREFERVGGTHTLTVNIRIVAATNRDLKDAVSRRSFREDLYYRLNVVEIRTPPLRERRVDIPLLSTYFLHKSAARIGRRVLGIAQSARLLLSNYDWPGNVRELENAIERAVALGSSDLIQPEDLPESILEAAREPASIGSYHASVKRMKRELIAGALEQTNGNFTRAAQLLGVNPTYLHRLVRNLELRAAPMDE